ncbi:MAG TPA: peptidase inhibitor family I36 protein [Dehalococcoidia bacterium]|nr:peptidase inhibitor family I36 protein [Dehalococcoidia bacterium]
MKRYLLFALAVLGAGLVGLSGGHRSAALASTSGSVVLYTNANYSGISGNFFASVPDLRVEGFNDVVSSIRSTEQVPVAVYSDINYGGTCQMVPTTGIPSLVGSVVGNDTISSLRLNAVCPGEIVFYRDANYQGALYEDRGNQPIANFKDIGMNDAVSSIARAAGVQGAVYRDANPAPDWSGGFYDYDGKGWGGNVCQPITSDHSTLSNSVVGDDKISGYLPGTECRLVILFSNKDFGGDDYVAPSFMDRDLSEATLCPPGFFTTCFSFNDVASSIANFTGGPVAVYSDAGYTGRCQTITKNVRNLSGSYVGNDAISSLKVGASCS